MRSNLVFEAILVTITIITILNYLEVMNVDLKLLFVLLSIGLCIVYKYKAEFPKPDSKVEAFSGSEVAFDKEAFINLNKIVAELLKKNQTTIPGNLIVEGTITCKGTAHFEQNLNIADGKQLNMHKKSRIKFGFGAPDGKDTDDGTMGWNIHGRDGLNIVGKSSNNNKRNTFVWGNVQMYNSLLVDKDVRATGAVEAGPIGKGMMRMKNGRIGNQFAGDIAFDNGGWKRCFKWNTTTLYTGIAATALHAENSINNNGKIYGRGIITTPSINVTTITSTNINNANNLDTKKVKASTIYTHLIDTDQLKGHAWGAKGHIYIPDGITLRKSGAELSIYDKNCKLKADKEVYIYADGKFYSFQEDNIFKGPKHDEYNSSTKWRNF